MKKLEKHGGFLCLVGMMCLLVACQSVEPGATYTPQWVDQLSTIQLNEEFTSEDQIPDYTNQEAQSLCSGGYQLPDLGNSLADLAEQSDTIVVGHITHKKFFDYLGIPSTLVTIKVDEVLKGTPPQKFYTVANCAPMTKKEAKDYLKNPIIEEDAFLYNPLVYMPFEEPLLFFGREVDEHVPGIPNGKRYATRGMFQGVYGIHSDGTLYNMSSLIDSAGPYSPIVSDALENIKTIDAVRALIAD